MRNSTLPTSVRLPIRRSNAGQPPERIDVALCGRERVDVVAAHERRVSDEERRQPWVLRVASVPAVMHHARRNREELHGHEVAAIIRQQVGEAHRANHRRDFEPVPLPEHGTGCPENRRVVHERRRGLSITHRRDDRLAVTLVEQESAGQVRVRNGPRLLVEAQAAQRAGELDALRAAEWVGDDRAGRLHGLPVQDGLLHVRGLAVDLREARAEAAGPVRHLRRVGAPVPPALQIRVRDGPPRSL